MQSLLQHTAARRHRHQKQMFGVCFEKNICHSHGQIYGKRLYNFLKNFWRTAVEFGMAFLKESDLFFAASPFTAPRHKSVEILEQPISHVRSCLSTKCFPTHWSCGFVDIRRLAQKAWLGSLQRKPKESFQQARQQGRVLSQDGPELVKFSPTLRQKFFQKLSQPNPKFTLGCDKSSFKNQGEVKTLSPYPCGANLWPQEACRKLEPFLCSFKL